MDRIHRKSGGRGDDGDDDDDDRDGGDGDDQVYEYYQALQQDCTKLGLNCRANWMASRKKLDRCCY